MRFCKDCGKVLNLFGDNEREYCAACNRPPKSPHPNKKKSGSESASITILEKAELTSDNNRIILRSKEGWELWSGPLGSCTDLQNILKRAAKIYEIRLKRQKN